MAEYYLEPTIANLHGNFSAEHKPILTIDSGDTVVFKTLDASWQVKHRTSVDDAPEYFDYGPKDDKRGDGHCLIGPVAINGAKPGMTLEIQINEVICGDWGWTGSGGWDHWIHKGLKTDTLDSKLLWQLDSKLGIGENQYGHKVRLAPFMGVMGMPPEPTGFHSTVPPRTCGGNLDCKELVAGTSLFLPISVDSALLSVGDGHAVQGDGEACVTAIECPMERVSLTLRLHSEMPINAPRARIKGAWVTMGLNEDLDEACIQSLSEMVSVLMEQHPELDRATALALISVGGDVRVTQLVNRVIGAHTIFRDDAIQFSS